MGTQGEEAPEAYIGEGNMVTRIEARCPICMAEGAFNYVDLLYDVPYYGKVLISVGRCGSCGYRFFDLLYADAGEPSRYTYTAEDQEDVARTIIIRSKTGSIYSPDLGFSLEPGPYAEPFITTLEGLLHRTIDYAERLLVTSDEARDKVEQFIERVRKVLETGSRFSIVVEDPEGKSIVIPPPGREGRLTRETIKVPGEK